MKLTADRFPEFFAAVYGDQIHPYRWQQQMLESILETGRWPEVLDVPTGGGKSAVIDIHVFANAVDQQRFEDDVPGPRVPRRISTVVPRRAIVDQQLDRATVLAGVLSEEATGILAEVRELLIRRSTPEGYPESSRLPLRVHLLRGGTAAVAATGRFGSARDDWTNYPAAVQVLCATPDMLGSRLLFRGYGVSRRARSRAAGLLGYDHVAVIDEAHLSRQLVDTFRRISSMTARWSPVSETIPGLQVCAATATHDPGQGQGQDENAVCLDWDHLEPHLSGILTTPKQVEYRGITAWNGTSRKARAEHIRSLMESVKEIRADSTGLVGVVVNRVATAVAVQEAAAKAGLSTRLVVGPMRFGATGSLDFAGVDLVVATQTIEVGVDIDFAGMVTDLATGSALVQRAGRVNRSGTRPSARVIVVGPERTDPISSGAALPYLATDLHDARDWVLQRAAGDGISPGALKLAGAPSAAPERPVFSHLDASDVRLLARTSETLVADPDLSFWLRDSLDQDSPEIRVIGRRLPSLAAPEDVTDQQAEEAQAEVVDATYQLLPHLVFDDSEAYPTTPVGLRRILQNKHVLENYQAWVRRDGDWFLLQNAESVLPHAQPISSLPLRAGDLVVLDANLPCTIGMDSAGEGTADEPGVVLAAEGQRPIGDFSTDASTGVIVFHHDGSERKDTTEGTRVCRAAHDEAVAEDGTIDATLLPTARLNTDHVVYDVAVGPATAMTGGEPAWVVCRRRDPEGQGVQVEVSPNAQPVLLETHQADVADRARALGHKLGLPTGLVEALAEAGLHHDSGKVSEAFQAMLRANGTNPTTGWSENRIREIKDAQEKSVYAKSLGLVAQPSKTVTPAVTGWRHEMYSTAMYWADSADGSEILPQRAGTRELTAWLVGTHHGEGRSGFPLSVPEAIVGNARSDVKTAARQLFAEGLWDGLAALLNQDLGPWGLAYLEALLRAADVTISQEGR